MWVVWFYTIFLELILHNLVAATCTIFHLPFVIGNNTTIVIAYGNVRLENQDYYAIVIPFYQKCLVDLLPEEALEIQDAIKNRDQAFMLPERNKIENFH